MVSPRKTLLTESKQRLFVMLILSEIIFGMMCSSIIFFWFMSSQLFHADISLRGCLHLQQSTFWGQMNIDKRPISFPVSTDVTALVLSIFWLCNYIRHLCHSYLDRCSNTCASISFERRNRTICFIAAAGLKVQPVYTNQQICHG